MELTNLRKAMLEAATSEMTNKLIRKLLLSNIGVGLLTLEDDQGNSVMFNTDGTVEETDSDAEEDSDAKEKLISELKNDYSMASLYFAYSFGGGRAIFVRKGDKFVPPKKTIKTWQDAFPNRDVNAWERKVVAGLSKIDPRMPNAWIDYDSDFGYQGIILYISKNTQEDYELEDTSL